MRNLIRKKKQSFAILLMIFSSFCVGEASAQNIKVKGVVSDKTEPIVGATIMPQSNSKAGTSTDVNGSFTVNTKIGDVLVISSIGYETQRVKVEGPQNLKITLVESERKLDEVTVVAFGKQKKESVIAAVSTVRPSELRVPTSNLTTALGGRIAGLITMQTSGEPGADNAQFFVRGVATFNNYSRGPLILIDNMRDIIRNERMVELSFEGQRYWDLKRWMLSSEYLNKPIRGWNAEGTAESDYYLETYIYQRKFAKKDYFWPIRQKSIDSNHKLVQNLGW